MAFLYENIESIRNYGQITPVPQFVLDNLNPNMPVRPYQKEALENFIFYFENPRMRRMPSQTLFHMATGSGKTYIMAALIIYLYKKGYRNFLFFVNLGNIVKKTEANFLDISTAKYLFADDIMIDGQHVKVNKIENFQDIDPDAINICFSTIQGLHSNLWTVKENSLTIDDFQDQKVVFISDEAHHLNADTKSGKKKSEDDDSKTWEETVNYAFQANPENVLLEFTATCDLSNPAICKEYTNKIIYNYPLKRFREDLYSKEIKTLRTDLNVMDKCLQALILSQYRLKVFKDHKLDIRPVILFKASKIAESKERMQEFIDMVKNLQVSDIERLHEQNSDEIMKKAFEYFSTNGLTFNLLVQELKDAFSEEHCVSVNEDKDLEQKQLLLNSLEDLDNPYRAIFEVKKLDEGWDVLNLFDIVRLYETRQSGGKKISPVTVSEAQLIGRGSRYCPFTIDDGEKFKRKYDNDLENPLRVCETLYYHCQNDSRYIGELHQALREVGIELNEVERVYRVKDSFRESDIYKGFLFVNSRAEVSRNDIYGIKPSIIEKTHLFKLETGISGEDLVMEDDYEGKTEKGTTYTTEKTIAQIAKMNYAIVFKAMAAFSVLKFDVLKKYFPNLKSTREFINSKSYLGDIKLVIKSRYKELPMRLYSQAVKKVLEEIADTLSKTEVVYEGTTEFKPIPVEKVITDKAVRFSREVSGGQAKSQKDSSNAEDVRIDLENEDWYAFNDNYGTSEEKAMVAFVKEYIDKLLQEYDTVYLVRNERHFHIYSFEAGERFEPDFVLFLQKENGGKIEQSQIFLEPKGTHLIEKDKWKEDFLLAIEDKATCKKGLADPLDYKLKGFHFFNRDERAAEFKEDMEGLLKDNIGHGISNISIVNSKHMPVLHKQKGVYDKLRERFISTELKNVAESREKFGLEKDSEV